MKLDELHPHAKQMLAKYTIQYDFIREMGDLINSSIGTVVVRPAIESGDVEAMRELQELLPFGYWHMRIQNVLDRIERERLWRIQQVVDLLRQMLESDTDGDFVDRHLGKVEHEEES